MAKPTAAPPSAAAPPQPAAAAAADQSSGGPTWVDAAPLLARACAAMAPGELVQADSFSLFESVSAVEIGEHRVGQQHMILASCHNVA